MVNTKHSAGGVYEIADCVRMCFSSVRNQRSARTGRRPRKRSRGSPVMVTNNERLELFSYKIAD
jgi:hypothetical protein